MHDDYLIVLMGCNLTLIEMEEDEMHLKYWGANSDLTTFGRSNFDSL